MEVDPQEIQALRDQMTFLQQKIKILEDAEKADVSAEKAQLRYLFQQFSSNSGTTLTHQEFHQFLTVLTGQPFSEQELHDLLKEINRGADAEGQDIISFIPFYNLWTRQGAVFSPVEHKLNNTKQLLLSGLARKTFSRAIQRFFSRQKRLLNPLKEESAELHVRVRTADFGESKCGFTVKYFDDPVMAAERRLALKLPAGPDIETSMIFSFAFRTRPDVDEFSLGEVAGSLKDLLALAKEELGSTFHNVQLANEDNARLFRVSVMFPDSNEALEMIKSSLNEAKVESLTARVEFSHPLNFQTDANSTERLCARAQVDMKASNSYVELLLQAMAADSAKKSSRRALRRKAQDPIKSGVTFLRSLQNVTLDVNLDAFAKAFLQSFEDDELIGTIPLGWNAVRSLLAKNLLPAFSDESIPPLVFDTFFNTMQSLGELHSIIVQWGDNVYKLSCENMPILTLLPLKKQLQELHAKEEEQKAKVTATLAAKRKEISRPRTAAAKAVLPPLVVPKPKAKPSPPAANPVHMKKARPKNYQSDSSDSE